MDQEKIEHLVRDFLLGSDNERTVVLKIRILLGLVLDRDLKFGQAPIVMFHNDGLREASFTLINANDSGKSPIVIKVRVTVT